jgi:hypothetical protein
MSACTGLTRDHGRPQAEKEHRMIKTVEHTQQPDVPPESRPAHQWFVGIDWGDQNHQVCVLDRQRRRVGARVVPHEGSSLVQLAAW